MNPSAVETVADRRDKGTKGRASEKPLRSLPEPHAKDQDKHKTEDRTYRAWSAFRRACAFVPPSLCWPEPGLKPGKPQRPSQDTPRLGSQPDWNPLMFDILAAAVIALAPVKQAPPSSDAPSPPAHGWTGQAGNCDLRHITIRSRTGYGGIRTVCTCENASISCAFRTLLGFATARSANVGNR